MYLRLMCTISSGRQFSEAAATAHRVAAAAANTMRRSGHPGSDSTNMAALKQIYSQRRRPNRWQFLI